MLSGFLITEILRKARHAKHYWRPFYIKRVARLGPVLLITLLVVAALFHHFSWIGFLGYIFFLGNWVSITSKAINPLVPLWSLAVEEHFYFAWPSAVRRCKRRTLIAILVATIVAEPVLRLVVSPHTHTYTTIYFLTPFRLDAIACGSLIALIKEDEVHWSLLNSVSGYLFGILACLVLVLMATVPGFKRDVNSLIFNSIGYSLVAAVLFFGVAWVIKAKGSIADRILSHKVLVYVGSISYGMYLFGQIISVFIHKAFHIPFAHHRLQLSNGRPPCTCCLL